MALRLADRWVWDSWVADTGSEFHLFFLQAPRSLGEEPLRHWHATVGHAVSTDLCGWRVLEDALLPGPPGTWDDLATWTGSAIEHEGTWYILYTGGKVSDKASGQASGKFVPQALGLATSTDLVHWQKHSANPVLELDPRWYELVGLDAWRDPWVLPDPGGDGFHALITARTNQGPPDARGVIGHARSADLLHWEVGPPLSEPGEFGHLEVPQSVVVDGTPVLLFSVAGDRFTATRRPGHPAGANVSYIAIGESLLGPWDIGGARLIPVPDLYAPRLVRDRTGEWQVLGFRDGSWRGDFAGEIMDPVPLRDLDLV